MNGSCRDDVNDACLEFDTDQTAILRRQFSCCLPPCITSKLEKTSKTNSDDDTTDDDKRLSGKRKRKAEKEKLDKERDAKVAKNKAPLNKSWLLAKDEKFGKVFHTHIDSVPKDGEKQVCIRYHIKGSCFKSCRNVHGSLSGPAKSAFNDWVISCRESAAQDFAGRGD